MAKDLKLLMMKTAFEGIRTIMRETDQEVATVQVGRGQKSGLVSRNKGEYVHVHDRLDIDLTTTFSKIVLNLIVKKVKYTTKDRTGYIYVPFKILHIIKLKSQKKNQTLYSYFMVHKFQLMLT